MIPFIYIVNNKTDFFVDGESVTQKDIAAVDAEIIQELEDLYEDDDDYEIEEEI